MRQAEPQEDARACRWRRVDGRAGLVAALGLLLACQGEPAPESEYDREVLAVARERMVKHQLEARDIVDEEVLRAMRHVPRHLFVPARSREFAYGDHPLPIGHGQTISQPYIVAYMTQALELEPTDRVLEVGTGSGYQAAVLAELVKQVYSIEIVSSLADNAGRLLQQLGYTNVHVRTGDGYRGWPEAAPFDAIMVTAAPSRIPQPLIDQLKAGGRMVVPIGRTFQELTLLVKEVEGHRTESLLPVQFVPMTGEALKEHE
ncbi:MAG: protein-L-isoaspartate(D-aspartate) O-methyltransferase [Candidatus Latescibacterota bacterium]